MFSGRFARLDARRYRRRGLDGSSRDVVADLAGVDGAEVLEVGGGIGAIQLELLKAGASHATNVELSRAYEPEARRLAIAAGLADRAERRIGDFVTMDGVVRADIVVLHRVVCCYPDMPAMVRRAGRLARRRLAITYPRDRWWVRLGFRATNLFMRLRRSTFRVFVHDPGKIVAVARSTDLEETQRRRGVIWETVVLERSAA